MENKESESVQERMIAIFGTLNEAAPFFKHDDVGIEPPELKPPWNKWRRPCDDNKFYTSRKQLLEDVNKRPSPEASPHEKPKMVKYQISSDSSYSSEDEYHPYNTALEPEENNDKTTYKSDSNSDFDQTVALSCNITDPSIELPKTNISTPLLLGILAQDYTEPAPMQTYTYDLEEESLNCRNNNTTLVVLDGNNGSELDKIVKASHFAPQLQTSNTKPTAIIIPSRKLSAVLPDEVSKFEVPERGSDTKVPINEVRSMPLDANQWVVSSAQSSADYSTPNLANQSIVNGQHSTGKAQCVQMNTYNPRPISELVQIAIAIPLDTVAYGATVVDPRLVEECLAFRSIYNSIIHCGEQIGTEPKAVQQVPDQGCKFGN